ncbi:TIGR03086 family metal-binding protein [Spirillospora sp. NPDC047279]|uniref:TIGR03086 family metal-binding protein n=1 Tax=Spirillospora sp. NPDC047279 TaxID=3155478 RepID=UPI0033DA406D
MEMRALMMPAAEAATRIVRAVPDEALTAPTPCPDWDVRATINHLIFWTGHGATAAGKAQPPEGPGEEHDFVADGDWAGTYARLARESAEAWSKPEAWEGNTSLTGSQPGMPAAMIGGMLLSEYVLHGWDLAVAAGVPYDVPQEVVQAAYDHMVPTAEMGRQYEAFGPEVAVPEDAPVLDRLLGLSGRNPDWKA